MAVEHTPPWDSFSCHNLNSMDPISTIFWFSESLERDLSNGAFKSNYSLPDLTLTESQTEEPHKFKNPPRGPASVSSASNPVITPLNLTSELHPLLQPTSEASSLTMTHFNHLLPPPSSLKTNSSKTDSPLSSSVAGRGQLDTQSCLTTSSEMEFKKDLASLDADIARLQIQFRVALQTSS